MPGSMGFLGPAPAPASSPLPRDFRQCCHLLPKLRLRSECGLSPSGSGGCPAFSSCSFALLTAAPRVRMRKLLSPIGPPVRVGKTRRSAKELAGLTPHTSRRCPRLLPPCCPLCAAQRSSACRAGRILNFAHGLVALGPVDGQPSGGQVHVAPAKREQFAATYPAEHQRGNHGPATDVLVGGTRLAVQFASRIEQRFNLSCVL